MWLSLREQEEFENGDVLCSVYTNTIVIFKENEKDGSRCFYSHYNTDLSSNKDWNREAFRHATEEEKQLLFDKMKEQGLKWNAENKRVEKIRWRAKSGKEYYYVDNQGILMVDTEGGHIIDANRHNFGNYFRSREQDEEAAKRMKEVLRKYHEEIGE